LRPWGGGTDVKAASPFSKKAMAHLKNDKGGGKSQNERVENRGWAPRKRAYEALLSGWITVKRRKQLGKRHEKNADMLLQGRKREQVKLEKREFVRDLGPRKEKGAKKSSGGAYYSSLRVWKKENTKKKR